MSFYLSMHLDLSILWCCAISQIETRESAPLLRSLYIRVTRYRVEISRSISVSIYVYIYTYLLLGKLYDKLVVLRHISDRDS